MTKNQSLKEQLENAYRKDSGNMKNQSRNKKNNEKKGYFSELPLVSDWKEDGVDHININNNFGKSDLGRTLHPSSPLVFEHDIFGRFNSISAFWDFIETGGRDDRFRYLPHSVRLELKRKMELVEVPQLRFIILDACWQRIRSYERLKQTLVECDLPFDSYRLAGNFRLPQRVNHVEWLVEGLNFIRRELKKGQVPNFVRWSNQKKRRAIFEEYADLYLRKPTVASIVKTENELLKELVKEGPKVQQPQRRFRPSISKPRSIAGDHETPKDVSEEVSLVIEVDQEVQVLELDAVAETQQELATTNGSL